MSLHEEVPLSLGGGGFHLIDSAKTKVSAMLCSSVVAKYYALDTCTRKLALCKRPCMVGNPLTFESPPMHGWRRCVSLELRYGMWRAPLRIEINTYRHQDITPFWIHPLCTNIHWLHPHLSEGHIHPPTHLSKGREGLVDGSCFYQPYSRGFAAGDAFWTRQVHQGQPSVAGCPGNDIVTFDLQRKQEVRPRAVIQINAKGISDRININAFL